MQLEKRKNSTYSLVDDVTNENYCVCLCGTCVCACNENASPKNSLKAEGNLEITHRKVKYMRKTFATLR